MKKLRFVTFILLVSIVFAGCGGGTKTNNKSAAKPANNINKDIIEASGVVQSSKTKNLLLDFNADISSVNVKEGQKVKKGQSLFTMDFSDINAQINSKVKELDAENFNLKNLQRDREILDRNDSTSSEVQTVPNASQTSSGNKDDMKYEKDNEIKAENDKIATLQSDLNALKGKLNKTFIKGNDIVSDIDNGIVSEIMYKPGDVFNTQQKLCSLTDASSLMIEVKVDEEFIKDVQLGKTVNIIPIADNSKKYTGKVTGISSIAVTANGETSVTVDISIDNNDGFLKPNYNVDVEINKK